MKRRGFLKGLGTFGAALALVVPKELKAVAAKPELSNLEKAKKIDSDFTSPFMYVYATEDLNQGDVVAFDPKSEHAPYAVKNCGRNRNRAAGISATNVARGNWYFIQTVGHCKLPINKDNYFKSF